MPHQLTVQKGPHAGVDKRLLQTKIRAMMNALNLVQEEVSFVLTNDEEIHQLNFLYRKIDRPTDVLAFAQREGELGHLAGTLLGDVIVSVPTARKQAKAAGHPLEEELTMLLAHGLLHLLGWDHETPAKDRRMTKETDRLRAAAALAASTPASKPRRLAERKAPKAASAKAKSKPVSVTKPKLGGTQRKEGGPGKRRIGKSIR